MDTWILLALTVAMVTSLPADGDNPSPNGFYRKPAKYVEAGGREGQDDKKDTWAMELRMPQVHPQMVSLPCVIYYSCNYFQCRIC